MTDATTLKQELDGLLREQQATAAKKQELKTTIELARVEEGRLIEKEADLKHTIASQRIRLLRDVHENILPLCSEVGRKTITDLLDEHVATGKEPSFYLEVRQVVR